MKYIAKATNRDQIILACNSRRRYGIFLAFVYLFSPWLIAQTQVEMVTDLYLYIGQMTELNGQAYFVAKSSGYGDGYGLWKSDGTDAGTQFITDINSPDIGGTVSYYELTTISNLLYFRSHINPDPDGVGYELWRTDGTDVGTIMLTSGVTPENLGVYNNQLVFLANHPDYGLELWKSDGTPSGTTMIKDIKAGTGSGVLTYLYGHTSAEVNGIYYFRAGYTAYDIWRTDGTEEGTYRAIDAIYTPSNLTSFKNKLLFSYGTSTSIGRELYQSDGTDGSTTVLKDICYPNDGTACRYSTNSSSPSNFVVTGNLMFFMASDYTHGNELWVTDGTTEGTHLVKDLNPTGDASISQQTAFNGLLYFVYNDGIHGSELWRSDGTETGTVMLKDIYAESASSSPDNLAVAGNYLYFVANSPGYGRELWMTDGTEAGTQMVQDIYPGGSSSNAALLTNINGTLFLRARYTETQYRLWKVSFVPDAYEGDNSDDDQQSATVILLNDSEPQTHNFHVEGDSDWVKFYAMGGKDYEILAENVGPQADIIIKIYDSAGNLLETINDQGQGGTEQLSWTPSQNGSYFLEVSEAENRFGTDTEYDLKPSAKVVSGAYGIIRGIISSDQTAGRLAGALVTSKYNNLANTFSFTTPDGQYLLLTKLGTAEISSQLSGYQAVSQSGIAVTAGSDLQINLTMQTLQVENDSDEDGIPNEQDAFENDPAGSVDTDGDGRPDDWNPGCILDCLSSSSLTLDDDDDNDGLPDDFENANNLNPLVDDSAADLDNDGYSNLEEYQAGTDPDDTNDFPTRSKAWKAIIPLILNQ